MAIDLLHDDPASLVDADLGDVLAAARMIERWTPHHAEVLDYVFTALVARLLSVRAPSDDLLGAHDHIRRVAAMARTATDLDPTWEARWRGMAAVLDARIGILAKRDAAGPQNRAHYDGVLALLSDCGREGVAQSEIGAILSLRKANLSRVLGLMEAEDLITRRTVGREKRVFPGPAAPAPAKTEVTPHIKTGSVPGANRGLALLTRSA